MRERSKIIQDLLAKRLQFTNAVAVTGFDLSDHDLEIFLKGYDQALKVVENFRDEVCEEYEDCTECGKRLYVGMGRYNFCGKTICLECSKKEGVLENHGYYELVDRHSGRLSVTNTFQIGDGK